MSDELDKLQRLEIIPSVKIELRRRIIFDEFQVKEEIKKLENEIEKERKLIKSS